MTRPRRTSTCRVVHGGMQPGAPLQSGHAAYVEPPLLQPQELRAATHPSSIAGGIRGLGFYSINFKNPKTYNIPPVDGTARTTKKCGVLSDQ